MFRDVPECSGMFHVPGFIDAPIISIIIDNNDNNNTSHIDRLPNEILRKIINQVLIS